MLRIVSAIALSEMRSSEAGEPRDLVIKKWCECVWAAYENSHAAIATLAKMELAL
jgi:hypothetical protein